MTMPNVRVLPPGTGKTPTINIGGRVYTGSLGNYVDIPMADGQVAAANGWTVVARDGVGPTSARPAPTGAPLFYLDTTLGYVIVHEGSTWRNPATGAAV